MDGERLGRIRVASHLNSKRLGHFNTQDLPPDQISDSFSLAKTRESSRFCWPFVTFYPELFETQNLARANFIGF